MNYIVAIIISSLLFVSCKTTTVTKPEAGSSKKLETKIKQNLAIKGTVKKQELTTYQYGSHTFTTESKTYALQSKTVNLDDFVGKEITILGEKIDGYPLSGGPEYIKVLKIVR